MRGSAQALDLTISNVKGMPHPQLGRRRRGRWRRIPFVIGGPALAVTLISGPSFASLGVVTCPEAVTDPEHLMGHLADAFEEVSALGG